MSTSNGWVLEIMPMWPNFGDYQRWLGFGDGAGMAGIGEY